jgi:hypothetical protein
VCSNPYATYSSVFLVEDIEGRQADVRDFLLGEDYRRDFHVLVCRVSEQLKRMRRSPATSPTTSAASQEWPDLADRFPLAAEAVAALPVRSCVIDCEAIVCDDSGLAVFDLIRGLGRNGRAILCAFDLLEVNGEDIRKGAHRRPQAPVGRTAAPAALWHRAQ